MFSKVCGRCGERKPLADFYRDGSKSDGRQSRCRKCQVAANRESRTRNPETYKLKQARDRERYGRKPCRTSPPTKRRAHQAVARALLRGDLVRPEFCERCGVGGRIEGHHTDYAQALVVEWLCPRCHALADGRVAA